MEFASLIADLVRKYQKPGPRYTSYPSALHFDESVAIRDLLHHTENTRDPYSLYFHIPFCERLCWFCGCHTIITRSPAKADYYLDLLERELDLFLDHMQQGRETIQMHIGGGTPNFLSVEQIQRLADIIHHRFAFSEVSENSVELAPVRLSEPQVYALRDLGMNRASFGVQDCNPEVQEAVNRIQSVDTNRQAMAWLRQAGFKSVNIDLMYGLPKQSVASFGATIDHALDLNPDRIALFGYAHVPWMKPAQKELEKRGLPDGQERLEIFLFALQKLMDAGYRYIGMDHFAKPEDELCRAQDRGELYRNFQGYSTRAGHEILAFGISSISQSSSGFRQNVKTLREYETRLNAGQLPIDRGVCLTDEDHMRASIIQQVMCNLKLDGPHFRQSYGDRFTTAFSQALPQLIPMQEDGLLDISIDTQSLAVSDLGRFFIRNIAMTFDAYLRPQEKPAYSKTV